MLIVAKTTPTTNDLLAHLATPVGLLEAGARLDDARLKLYAYQRAYLTSGARFRAVLKARQSGFSLIFAAEALALALLKPVHTAVFVSYNLDDAMEKIRHAEMLFDSLPAKWRKRVVSRNKKTLEFDDGHGNRSRILSLPCREPRGKGRVDVYLDELPYMRAARAIYSAAMPMITRGGGRMTVGSTPLGTTDIFHDVMMRPDLYPVYERYTVPWWHCPDFCTSVTRAKVACPHLTTRERVDKYGKRAIKDLFGGMDEDTFAREFDVTFQDDQTAFLPWELIKSAERDRDTLPYVDDVARLHTLTITGPLYAGYDVGRRRNASELLVLEQREGRFFVRCMQTLERESFGAQRDTLIYLLARRADCARLCIDATGMGMQLAEELHERFKHRAEGVMFTAPLKSELAGDLKIAFEDHNLYIPADRSLQMQLHSVRKTVTSAGNIRLDSEHDDTHHADKFWALALAVHAEGTKQRRVPLRGTVAGSRGPVTQYQPR